MQPARRRVYASIPPLLMFAGLLGLGGCASPGPPRPPSLQIPQLVSDLSATRSGDTVVLRFSVPSRTTDGLALRGGAVMSSLCRQSSSGGACAPVDLPENHNPLPIPGGAPAVPVVWTDPLPSGLASGPPRALAYRLELKNAAGRSAGPSDPVYAAAGTAPPPVAALRAEPARLGVVLRWTPVPAGGEVLLTRTQVFPAPGADNSKRPSAEAEPGAAGKSSTANKRAKSGPRLGGKSTGTRPVPGVSVLAAAPGDAGAATSVDATVSEGVSYRYTATRRRTVQIGGHSLALESAPSTPVMALWRDVYPPAMPTGLVALGYVVPAGKTASGTPGFAVDLVWQPVNDPRLAGYLVYRQTLDRGGEAVGPRLKLTAEPVSAPGYHDGAARAAEGYRYSVAAIDPKGNESAPVETVVEASGR